MQNQPHKYSLQKGFTLVELMVVVAIIGLLSAVAVPNFKKYQAKAKISEAKLQLSAIYTAETAFFSDYNMYHICLRYMGYDPDAERANRYYLMGFFDPVIINASAYAAAVNSGLLATSCPQNHVLTNGTGNTDLSATYFNPGKGVGSRIPVGASDDDEGCLDPTTAGTQASAATMTFTAGAYGAISSTCTYGSTCSCLTVNQNKEILTHSNGF